MISTCSVCSCSWITYCASKTWYRRKGVSEHIGLATAAATSREWRSVGWDWETYSKLTWTVSDPWPGNLGAQLLTYNKGITVLSPGRWASSFQNKSPPHKSLCLRLVLEVLVVKCGEGSRRYCCGNGMEMKMQTSYCIPVALFTAVTSYCSTGLITLVIVIEP